MLSLSKVGSAGGAAAYYEQNDNYYFLGESATEWFGKGAEISGLRGAVSQADFIGVLEGSMPDGGDLTHTVNGVNKHRPGWDLTFSAPKSVSVLALICEDKAVLDAHREAVSKTLGMIEKMASTRVMKDGITDIEATGNITAALFVHDTNRNLEPHLHTHAIVANATQDKDGNWKTLSSDVRSEANAFVETIWQNPVALGSLYRQFLKSELQEQGYTFRETGKNGQWEIEGVPTDEFSSRRKEIIEAVGEDATAKQKSVAAKDTRKKKDFSNIGEVRKEWKVKLDDLGFRQEELKVTSPDKSPVPRQEQEQNIKKIVKTVIGNLEKKGAKFSYDTILTKTINSMTTDQFSSLSDLRGVIKGEVQEGVLVPLNENETLFTTLGHLKKEVDIIRSVNEISDKKVLLSSSDNSLLINKIVKNESAFNAVTLTGSSGYLYDSVSKLSGLAEKNGYEHIVIAPDGETKKTLDENNNDSKTKIITTTQYAENHSDSSDKKIITLFQSEKMSTENISALLSNEKNKETVIISVDTKTKNSEGIFSDFLQKNNVNFMEVSEYNENNKILIIGGVAKSERMNMAAKQFVTLKAVNKNAVIQVGNNKDKEIADKTIRGELQKNGFLSEKSIVIKSESQIYLDDANRHDKTTYQSGFILENSKGKKRAEIIEVDKNNNMLVLKDGKKISTIAISEIDKNFNLYEMKDIELKEGDEIKVRGGKVTGRNGYANGFFSVKKIKEGGFLFGDRIVAENQNGTKIVINPKERNQVQYGYTEYFGQSHSENRTVIAVMNKIDTNHTNVNKINKSGGINIIISGMEDKKITSKISNPDSSIRHIPKTGDTVYEMLKSVREIKKETKSELDKVINMATDKAENGKVHFNGAAVVMNAVNLSPDIPVTQITTAIDNLIERGEFIPLTSASLTDNFVRKETLDNEVAIVKKIFDGKGSVPSLISGEVNFKNTRLTKGQKAAGELILKSEDSIIAIQGYAGVGKTTQFKTVAKTLEANRPDINLRGLAPTHKAVSELKSAGIDAQTIASFMQEKATGELNTDFSKTVFVIDETSMTGNKTLLNLIETITDNGGRIILSGDKDQLKSFDTGAPFKLTLERSAIDHVVLDEIVRQSPELKPAVEAIIKGDIKQSLDSVSKVRPDIVPRENQAGMPKSSIVNLRGVEYERHTGIVVRDYMSRTAEARDNTFIITPVNAERNNINESIHNALTGSGELKNSLTIATLQRVNSQDYDLHTGKFWQENTGGVAKIGNGYHQIEGITEDGIISLTDTGTGKESFLSVQDIDSRKVAVYQSRDIEISEGEKIRVTVTDTEKNTFNNDTGIVKAINGNQVVIDMNGQQVSFTPNDNMAERHLDYAYAITSYSSQGASIPYVIIYDGVDAGKRNLAALDNTYVELSRSKEHVQLYVDDLNAWTERVERQTGVRYTAHDIVYQKQNSMTEKALSEWEKSREVSQALSEKIPELLSENARYSGNKKELLLPVYNENGVHRGNYHLPVGVYSGEIDSSAGYYNGAEDGSVIVLNRGDSNKKIIEYKESDIDKAVQSESSDNTIIVRIEKSDNPDVNDALLSMENKDLEQVLKEITNKNTDDDTEMQQDDVSELLTDHKKEIIKESEKELVAESEKEPEVSEDKQIRHDEENILKHSEKELTKEMDMQL